MDWSESCPCHESQDLKVSADMSVEKAAAETLHRLRGHPSRQERHGRRHAPCPVAGMRAPEMAAGAAIRLVEGVSRQSALLLEADLVTVDPEDRLEILRGHDIGRDTLVLHLSIKLGFWQKIPHLLCILAHRNAGVAVDGAARILQQYNSFPDDHVHDILSILFCSPRYPLREFVVLMATRQKCIEEMPVFQCLVLRYLILSVNDRNAERPHVDLHRVFARAFDAKAHTADVEFRCNEIIALVEGSSEGFMNIVENLDKVPSPNAVLREHGFENHPTLQDTRNASVAQTWPIIYRCHRRELYDDRKQLQKQNADFKKAKRRFDKAAGLLHDRPMSVTHDVVSLSYQELALDHWRRSSHHQRLIYSMPSRANPVWEAGTAGPFIVELEEALSRHGLYSKPTEHPALEDSSMSLVFDGSESEGEQTSSTQRGGVKNRPFLCKRVGF